MKRILLIVMSLIFLSLPQKTQADQIPAKSTSANLATTQINIEKDNRVVILKEFLDTYNSPLSESAEDFVKSADKYDIDWKLVAAISGVESTFGKHIPYNSYNGWGWGVYGDNVIYFESWKDAIETISKGLRQNYIDRGATNVYAIGRIYAASPTWAQRVEYFMNRIRDYELRNPEDALSLSI
ncbi:MAG: hypothetical protein M1524_03245 [Patescibacteria group bacterium]|nr:hypothetical protein [Patescibacteria group bacterium]